MDYIVRSWLFNILDIRTTLDIRATHRLSRIRADFSNRLSKAPYSMIYVYELTAKRFFPSGK